MDNSAAPVKNPYRAGPRHNRDKDHTAGITTTEKTSRGAAETNLLSAGGTSAVTTAYTSHEVLFHCDKADIAELSGQGIYQIMLLLCTVLAGFILTSYTNALEVLAPPTAHWCKRLPAFAHLPSAAWKNMSIPVDDKGVYDRCHRYDPADPRDAENRTTVPCEDWEFDLKEGDANIVSAWRLVCGRTWLLTLGRIAYMFAAVVAVPLSGHISDVVGRRPVLCVSTVILILGIFAGCFARTFSFFVVNRMVISATVSVVLVTSFVLLFEENTPPYRVYHSALVHIGMNLGLFSASLLSHVHVDYHLIQALFTIPASLLLTTVYVAEESPRWLLATWDVVRAANAILWIGKVNGKAMEMEPFMATLKRNERIAGDVTHKPLRELIQSDELRRRLIVLCCCRFFITFTLQGLIIGERELRIAWLKPWGLALRAPALIGTYFAVNSYGRKRALQMSIFSTCTGTLALAMSRMTKDTVVSAALSTLTKAADTAALFTFYIYSMELFPTIIRNFSFCATYGFGRIGGAVAPFLTYLASGTHVSMPFVLMSAVGLACHHLVQYLPETRSLILMDALEEMDEEEIRKKLAACFPAREIKSRPQSKQLSKETMSQPMKKKRFSVSSIPGLGVR